MRVIITGGTGLIGKALAARLAQEGDEPIVLSRDPEKAKADLPPGVRAEAWDGKTGAGWSNLIDAGTTIVHLAGAGVADERWTPSRKREIRDSRIVSGAAVLAAIREAPAKPRALLQASAVGYYGPRGDEPIDETEPPGDTFLAEVCIEWEESTREVEAQGIRRAILRTGIVLTPEGGALAKMLLPAKLGANGPLGSGRQGFPWIHLEDEIAAIRFLIDRDDATGPFNLTAPNPPTQAEFAKALGHVLHRPSFVPAPAFALRLALGEMADMLLDGHHVVPKRLLELGYRFRFPDLGGALGDLLG
ncbi:MAG TPA: TIGR01777 family oxidoreductase [Thermoanaerobaculia bacterium]|nr:TIGR01777 family oxidoreductase [Thermoanaerobaculia bacterium]